MSTAAAPACTGEPVSWLRLERYALGELGAAERSVIEAHLAGCETCRACLGRVQEGAVGLLPLPARATLAPWWRRLLPVPVLALAGAAAAALLATGRPSPLVAPVGAAGQGYVGIKGDGELAVALVRERAGEISADPVGFAAGDRFKVLLTCPPGQQREVVVAVLQDGAADLPLTATIACGSRVALPGAFRMTGGGEARVCVVAASARATVTGTSVPAGAPCAVLRPVPLDGAEQGE